LAGGKKEEGGNWGFGGGENKPTWKVGGLRGTGNGNQWLEKTGRGVVEIKWLMGAGEGWGAFPEKNT